MTYFPPITNDTSVFGNQVTTERKILAHANPFYADGESVFRILETLTGTATFTVVNNSEWRLSTAAAGADEVEVKGHDNPRFFPGSAGEIGWTVRAPDSFTGSQLAEWGLRTYSGDDGLGWGVNSSGLYIWTKKAGSKATVASSSFNIDPLSGLGPSGLSWDNTTYAIFTVELLSEWQRGPLYFCIYLPDNDNKLQRIVAHRFDLESGAIDTPIAGARPWAILDNGGTATARDIFFANYWTATIGASLHDPPIATRTIGQFDFGPTVNTTPGPMIGFRKKSGREDVPVYIQGFDVSTTDALLLYIKQNPTTTPTWTNPNSTGTYESAVEVDIANNGTNSGTNRWTGIVGSGTTIYSFEEARHPRIYLYENIPTYLYARTMSGTATRVDLLFRVVEDW